MTHNKHKIFQLITSINLGGAENVAFNLCEYCIGGGDLSFEFTIVELYRSNTDYANDQRIELKKRGIKIFSLFNGSKRLSLIFAPFILCRIIKNGKPSIIHSHTDLPDLVLASTVRLMAWFRIRMPEIVRTIHNTELWATHSRIAQYTESAFHNDIVIGVSKAALQAHYSIRKRNNLAISPNCQVIYNGCNVPVRSEISIPIDSDKVNIAFCGRLEHQKGIDILITRIRSVNLLYNDIFNFYIIGNGKFALEVNDFAKQVDNVFRYEAISSIANKLHHFDFILMPSRFEGLPLISIESSFSKVPVIASKIPGLVETLPANWPLLFDLNKENDLLYMFRKIANKEFDLKKLKKLSFDFVNENFTINSMIKEYNKIYISTCKLYN
jgi:glycosyltransferase involved in cell wall biosynthesis